MKKLDYYLKLEVEQRKKILYMKMLLCKISLKWKTFQKHEQLIFKMNYVFQNQEDFACVWTFNSSLIFTI